MSKIVYPYQDMMLSRVVSVKCTIFWVLTPSETSKQQGFACCLLHSDFLFGLFFHPEEAGEKFLRNTCGLLPDYTPFQVLRPSLSQPNRI
jgi:hypothetical protein